jgi:hypothetical protein
MQKFISNYCTICDPCSQAKASQHRPYGLLKQLLIPKRPWESISLNFIVELPELKSKTILNTYDVILVVVKQLTKMAIFILTTSKLRKEGPTSMSS